MNASYYLVSIMGYPANDTPAGWTGDNVGQRDPLSKT